MRGLSEVSRPQSKTINTPAAEILSFLVTWKRSQKIASEEANAIKGVSRMNVVEVEMPSARAGMAITWAGRNWIEK
jgi:hypothetical protein